MADIEISVEVPDVSSLSPRVQALVARAVTRAGGDALRTMNTVSVRKVRERKAMKAGYVRKFITPIFPTSGGPNGDSKSAATQWRLHVKGAGTPVMAYNARQTKAGVTAQINVGARSTIRHVFIATMKSGHKGVFMRYGQAVRVATSKHKGFARYAGQKRQPIRELYTTRVLDVFYDEDFIPAVKDAAIQKFTETFQRNVASDTRSVTRG